MEGGFNIESELVEPELKGDLKKDAIGSTLYSKTWALKTLMAMSRCRSCEKFSELSKQEEADLLSDVDSLLGMSASQDVATFLALEEGCFATLVAELLLPSPFSPSGVGQLPVEFQSHCLRRQELCLVIMSNIALCERAVVCLSKDESAVSYLVDLPVAACGFNTDNKDSYLEMLQAGRPQIQEFANVLEAFFRHLRNLMATLSGLLTAEERQQQPKFEPHVRDLCLKTFGVACDEVTIDSLALVMATSSNINLLTKVAKALYSLVEFVGDLNDALDVDSDVFFSRCSQSRNFMAGYVEAVNQSAKSDWPTCVLFVQVLGDVLVRCEDCSGCAPVHDDVLESLCDALTELVRRSPEENPMGSDGSLSDSCLGDCALISKSLSVVWTGFKRRHLPSFEALAEFLLSLSSSKFAQRFEPDGDVAAAALYETIADALRDFCVAYPAYEDREVFIQVSELLRKSVTLRESERDLKNTCT